MTQDDSALAWAAGVFEAAGSVKVERDISYKPGARFLVCELQDVATTDILSEFVTRWGGSIHCAGEEPAVWRVVAHSATGFLRALHAHFKFEGSRALADLACVFQDATGPAKIAARDKLAALDAIEDSPTSFHAEIGGSKPWPNDRLWITLRLLAFLPGAPGATLNDILRHLNVSRRRLFSLFSALREVDIEIYSKFAAEGHKLYWLNKNGKQFAERLLQ